MSWFNSSNFSDLASKALKNAQKQIDKALDIKDGEKKTDPEKKGAHGSTAKTEKGDNADFWSSWMGDSSGNTTDEKAKAPSDAWSMPWGASASQDNTVSEIAPERTAEEIKKEVLKAAKERTKAKSKLFPQKSRTDTENELKETEKKSVELSDKTDVPMKDEYEVNRQSETVSKDDKSISETVPTLEVKKELEVETVKPDDTVSVQKLKTLTDETVDLHKSTMEDPKNSDHGETGSDFKEISENDADLSVVMVTSSRDVSVADSVEENVHLEAATKSESSKNEYSSVAEVKTQPKDSTADVLAESKFTDISQDASTTSVCFDNSTLLTDPSGTDISSSVEFVTEQDIELSKPVNVEAVESCDNAGSDPELVDVGDKMDITGVDIGDKMDVTDEHLIEADKEEGIKNDFQVVASNDEAFRIGESESDIVEGKTAIINIPNDESKLHADALAQNSMSQDFLDNSMELLLTDQSDPEKLANIVSSDSESSVSKLDLSMDTCTSEETLVEVSAPLNEEDTQSHNTSFTEFTEGLEVKLLELGKDQMEDSDAITNDLLQIAHKDDAYEVNTDSEGSVSNDKSELSPANSFVKCMLEDAIDDSKQDDNSDSLSATEKSEGSRSVYSNHESSDEIDTTTSSDIEIISMPTPNGENRQVSPIDPVPLRIALQKTSWSSPTHRRTDSSDSSNTSKDGGYAELSPGREGYDSDIAGKSHTETVEGYKHGTELPVLSEEDDPLHPQKLLKESDIEESHDIESHDHLSHDLQTNSEQKLAEVSQILQAREEKLLQLSKENCDLTETNNILRNQMKQDEEAREAEMTDINELTTEFTQRLTDSEKRVAVVLKEKEILKNQLQDAHAELAKRAGDISLKEILAEKEEQIAELLQEGVKLSKSQLQSNNIIKKLRQKEKDNDSTITSQKKKLDTQTEELDHLHTVLESKEELEKKQTEAITQLNAAVKKQEQELTKYKNDYEEAAEKMRGLQAALDNSYKEMAELHRNNAAQDSKAQGIALSAEMQVREELKLQIEKQQQQYKWEKETYGMQIEDLQMTMTKLEKDHSRREDLLRQEIADLHKQLQEDEARTQELTQGVSLATRPLLRQIENLQSTYNVQSATWEKVEKTLSDRLSEAQNQLAFVTEKERSTVEQIMDLGSKVSTLEAQNSRLRQEKSQMTAQLEMLKSKVEMSEDAKQHEVVQIEIKKQQMHQEIADVKKEKVLLETELDVEKSKLEQEKKKSSLLQEQIRDLERDLQRSKSQGTPVRTTPSPVSVSRQDSFAGSLHEQSFQSITQEEIDRSFYLSSPNGNKQSLYEALRQSGAANLLENLQSQLKLRDGEINHLQAEIRSLERTRESMAKELVDLSNKNDDLEEKVKDLPLLVTQHQELDQRYNALLQMYGEKVEEANELRMDLSDVKEMYKAQITQLLGQT